MFDRNLVRTPRKLDAITDIAPNEEDPRRAGMSKRDVKAIWRAVEHFYRGGTQPAISVCVRRKGHVVLNRAIGHAKGNAPGTPRDTPRVPVRHDTPFCVFSASKAVTAIVMHALEDEGLLHLDDRVCDFIPEYAQNGKEWTTIRHVLIHRAGIPSVPREHNKVELLTQHDLIVDLLCQAKPVNVPGRRLAYHAITGGFVLAEIVKRVTGKDLRAYFAERFQAPLGARTLNYGSSEPGSVAENAHTGPLTPLPIRPLVRRAIGASMPEAVAISNTAEYLNPIIASGNLVGSADEMSRFYQMLLDGGVWQGQRILSEKAVRRALVESSYLELDLTLFAPVRYAQGLMLGAPRLSLYGPNTPNAFGHLGFIEVLAWADPDRELSAAILTTGKPFFGAHLRRLWSVLRAISKRCAP